MSSRDQSAAADLTPLSSAVFHILLSLGEGERHGYAIKREVAARTEGKLKLALAFCTDRLIKCWSWG